MRPPASACALSPYTAGRAALCREGCDPFSLTEEHRVHQGEERAGALSSHRREGSVDFPGSMRLQGLKPHRQCPGYDLRLSQLRCVTWIGWIPEDGHPRDLKHYLLEQLQLFPHEV